MARRQNKASTPIYTGKLADPLKPRYRPQPTRPKGAQLAPLNSAAPEVVAPFLLPPIFSVPDILGLPPIPLEVRTHAKWRREFGEKLPLLLDRFNIKSDDPHCWLKLTISLAEAHIPGFQVKTTRKGGRPREMNWLEVAALYTKFCELRKNGQTNRNAARLMSLDLQKAGRKATPPAILRRMQRYEKGLRAASGNINPFMGMFSSMQNLSP